MEIKWWIWLMPFASALTGWIITCIAVKMLFYPTEPKKYLGLKFQGLIPRKQKGFTEKLGKTLSQELISFDEIEQKIIQGDTLQKILPMVDAHIEHFLRVKLKESMPMIGMLIGDRTINQLKGIFIKELETLFPEIMKGYISSLKEDFDPEKLIAQKLGSFPPEKIASLLNKELAFVKMFGLLFGFIVGLVQAILLFILS